MIQKKIVIQSSQVKHTPKIPLMNVLFQKLNPLVLPQTISKSNLENEGNPSCIMSCLFLTITSVYSARMKHLCVDKIAVNRVHQIQENLAGRNVMSTSHVNSLLITHVVIVYLKTVCISVTLLKSLL